MSSDQHSGSNRREFLKTSAAAAATVSLVGSAHAAGKEEIKIALIGCGGRGTGAAKNAMDADERVKLVCMADVLDDRLSGSHDRLKKLFNDRVQVGGDQRFVGFDAFHNALKADVDYVILATPPHFRPEHLAAAIDAGKHVFMEKPVAVDPAGCRSVMASGEKAKAKGLSIVAGTQRRHEKCYLETYKRIQDGDIGQILSARCYWNMGQLWYKERGDNNWNDMEWMIRDWVNWAWLSGDHICEQHVHNIDVINWFTSKDGTVNHPVRAVGMGGRARRVTGDQYDFFSVDFEYADGLHLASYCRQINGCDRNVTESVVGDKGETHTQSRVCEIKGEKPFKFDARRRDTKQVDPYVQEHKDLIDSIVHSKGLNEANNVATSTMSAVMGRIAAYTGKPVTWEEVMDPNNSDPAFAPLGPKEYNWDVALLARDIPVPGRA